MPLTRASITHSSQVMLIAYPVFFLGVAAAYILGDSSRTASPSFDYVRHIQPIDRWGYMFLVVGVLEVVAWVVHRREFMVLALCAGFGMSVVWTLGFALALVEWHHGIVLLPGVSISATFLWAFVATAHIASLQSLTKDTR